MPVSAIAKNIMWSSEYVNTGAFQSDNVTAAITDFDVSGNMTKIIQAGYASTYPAAYAALNYAPSTAAASKGKWALPTAGILNSLTTNLNAINNTISKLGGTQLSDKDEYIGSSSKYTDYYVWVFYTYTGNSGVTFIKNDDIANSNVRPVLAF